MRHLIALDLAHMIGAAGGVVIGPVHTVARALALIDCTVIDAAILDYRLETQNVRSIADPLSKTGVPFLFYTSSRDEAELTYPILAKPTGRIELVSAMQRLLEGRQRR